ncbi:MAG: IS1595 family transposase [Candidatus Eremiobacteraeota bacterium]|nr:IS1595 family transposase [Candidatus Eremiobacteraeota bacterium]
MKTPRTLIEAVAYFADADRAHAYATKLRWPNGVACPRKDCGSASVQFIATRKLWRCKDCKRQFTAKVGTIFEDSPISFTKWLPAIWLLANTKNGTSSHELGRALGVTQKTAWFMFHRIRQAMREVGAPQFSGEVEADETFIGGKHQTNYFSKSGFRKLEHGPSTGKTTVFGVIQRGTKTQKSRVRVMVVPSHRASVLLPVIYATVKPGSMLYTDALRSYRKVSPEYMHQFVDHSISYVEGRVHTNCIENFWSCLKRTIKGTYIAPRPFHLDAYLDEQVFRFNARGGNDAERFVEVLKGTDGRRLTYKALTTSHPIWRLKPGRAARSPINLP